MSCRNFSILQPLDAPAALIIDENIIVSISKNYTNKFNASEIIKSLSNIIGGGGGGNPQIAQGGGTEINSQSKSIEAFKNIIQNA